MEENEKIEEKENETTNTEMKPLAEFEELNDRYKRLFAEFENYKKRTQKESVNKYAEITADVVISILPIMDNLEKAAEAKTEDTSYQEGIKLILKQFMDVLNRFGVEKIEALGKTFDPEFHEAVSHIEDPSKAPQEVTQVYREGYRIGNKVVRHSMVIVAN